MNRDFELLKDKNIEIFIKDFKLAMYKEFFEAISQFNDIDKIKFLINLAKQTFKDYEDKFKKYENK